MSDKIHELLNRNLQEVFGEGDAARHRAAIEELCPCRKGRRPGLTLR
jgi:hypothetical protein